MRSVLKTRPRKTRRLKPIHLAIVAIVASVAFGIWRYSTPRLPVYYVAYVGRDRPIFDEFHVRVLQKYLDELNEELPDKRIELKVFGNHQSGEGSRQVYEEILNDPRILLAVDNTWGRELQSVSDLIAANNLPVISMNADKGAADFNRNVAFISYDDRVPGKLTAFARKILKIQHVIFVAERDYKLTAAFTKEFQKNMVTRTPFLVNDFQAGNDSEQEKLFNDLDAEIYRWSQVHQEAPTIVLNVHGSWGNKIIEHLDARHHDLTFLGGPFIIDWATYRQEFGLNENRNRLIIFTYPRDSSINKVHEDVKRIKTKGVEVGKPNELLYVKRCLDAVSLIRGVLLDDVTWNGRPTISRAGFTDFFRHRLVENRFEGQYDVYVFDDDLLLADERSFEEYSRGKVFSYQQQLNNQDEPIPTVYFDITEITFTNVNLKSRTFHADFVLSVSSDQPGAEKNVHFPNARAGLIMEPIPASTLNSEPAEGLKGDAAQRHTTTLKVSADFNIVVDVGKYPFDTQELKIEIAVMSPQGASPRLSFDLASLKEDSLDEWTLAESYVTKDNHMVHIPVGTASFEKRPGKFQTATLRVLIKRRWEAPVVTTIMPLFLIAMVAIALLYIRDASFASQGQICVVIFLALLPYSPFGAINPKPNVLTIADKVFYCTFLTVLAVFLKVCLVNSRLIGAPLKNKINSRATLLGNVAMISYCVTIFLIFVFALR